MGLSLLGLVACAPFQLPGVSALPTATLQTNPATAIPTDTTPPPPPSPTPTVEVEPVLPTIPPPTATPLPQTGGGQLSSPPGLTTEELLALTEVPVRDQRLLAQRLELNGQEVPEVVNETAPNYQLGDTETFWVGDLASGTPEHFQARATLVHISQHAYWWVADGVDLDLDAIRRSAEVFENQTYPTNRQFFGSEWTPGVDNDPHVYIFLGHVPGVGGYYSSSDEYSSLVNEFSNEHEMFFINARSLAPGNSFFDGILAHEFQHMIHWHQDRNEPVWVNEGLSELAFLLNGFKNDQKMQAFLGGPDLQLNTWTSLTDARSKSIAHYGASYLFMVYFLERFGEEVMKAVVASPANGEAGFEAGLAEAGLNLTFDDVFADWLVANVLNDPSLAGGRYGYRAVDLAPLRFEERVDAYPAGAEATVSQYGADYIALTGQGDVLITFQGKATASLLDNQAHSGRYQWYSNRGDDVDSTLTRAFDLRGVEAATLTYWTWYDLEEDWDYAYVEVSTDGGQTWTALPTPHTRDDDPSGNAYGPGYTGQSGDGPVWIEESLDLSPYAGQEILIRFEYVTDDAVNRPGFAVDDIRIPEIGYAYDAETDDGGWQAEGFVRIDNVLRQRYIVQVIEIGEEVTVHRLALDANNQGSYRVQGLGDRLERAVLVVSAQAPVTTEPAAYRYQLR
ncbi:MAG: hypothetical protein ACE5H9_18825 [Anaerolineae bacterium]